MDIVKAMVERTQVDIDARGRYGSTPLLRAAVNGHLSAVQYLSEQGASKEMRSEHDWTPLHDAAANAHLSVVQCLCEQGTDMEARDENRYTPLHMATNEGHLPVAQYLSERGGGDIYEAIAQKDEAVGSTVTLAAQTHSFTH